VIVKIVLFPFALLYGIVVWIRNFLYDIGVFKSYLIPGKSILIGNLTVGGTGKSPHSLYLWEKIYRQHQVVILSRGYGRKTKGLIEVNDQHRAYQVGDEPKMFKKNMGEKGMVIVCEKRKIGAQFIREKTKKAVILLDDAFQHRPIQAGLSILLTEYNKPYYADYLLPVGRLRETKNGKKRAQILIVTKVPEKISEEKKHFLIRKLKFHAPENIFFSTIKYGEIRSFTKKKTISLQENNIQNILLIAGIANPEPLVLYLQQFCTIESIFFPDHYPFTKKDIESIHDKFTNIAEKKQKTIIITTEKDYMRLDDLLTDQEKETFPWYYQSISIQLDRENDFNEIINKYVNTN